MKKLLSFILSMMLLFSFAMAEEAEISLGALLYHESAMLFNQNGITININEIIQSGPEFFLKADCKNENDFPVQVLFGLPNQTDKDPFYSFRLNGADYYGAATTVDEDGNYYSLLYLSAHGELKDETIVIDPVELAPEGPWLNMEDITEGSFCLTAFMPPPEEEIKDKNSYVEWPVFFVVDQIRFNMAYESASLADPVNAEIPPLEAFAEGTPFFSAGGVTLTCQEASLEMDMSVFRPALMGTAVLRNDTDQAFTIEIYDMKINGKKGQPFKLQTGDGNGLFPAQSETVCNFSLILNEGMMPGEVTDISMALCCKGPESGNNLLYQPITMTVTQP